jgi:hypothetical protein
MRRFVVQLLVVVFGISALVGASLAAPKAEKQVPAQSIEEAPMTVVVVRNSDSRCEPNCPEWIAAEGEIVEATAALFSQVLAKTKDKKLPILIQSPGGSIETALTIGRMIRARGLTVAVGYTVYRGCTPAQTTCVLPAENNGLYDGTIEDDEAFCNSACPMVLAGGVSRIAGPAAQLGMHEPKTTYTSEKPQYKTVVKKRGNKTIKKKIFIGNKTVEDDVTYGLTDSLRTRLTAYYSEMGIDLSILVDTVKAKNEDLHFLPESRKDELKLRTGTSSSVSLANALFCKSKKALTRCSIDATRDPALRSALKQASVDAGSQASPMSFRLARLAGADCEVGCPAWIVAEGVITSKTPDAFNTFMNVFKVQSVPLVFDSPGGDLDAAIVLGRQIRESKLATAIGKTAVSKLPVVSEAQDRLPASMITAPGRCVDACVLAFAGGVQRLAAEAADVNMRNPAALKGSFGATSVGVSLNDHWAAMGIAPALLKDLLALKDRNSKSFSRAEQLDYAIATDGRDVKSLLDPETCRYNPQALGCFSTQAQP